jgi:hypothetical protein
MMPDETVEQTKPAKPFFPVVSAQKEPEAETPSAAARLRAVEDEWFGEDELRISGKIQDGHGSRFANLPHEKKKHYHALVHAVGAEKLVAEAHSALSFAEQKFEAAERNVEATAEALLPKAKADGRNK